MKTSGFNEQWDVTEVTENDLIWTVGCLITGTMDLRKGQTKATKEMGSGGDSHHIKGSM